MKNTTLKLAALLVTFGFTVGNAGAQTTTPVLTTAVPFLRISPDARAGGMADAGVATSPDAYNAYWNIAKTPFAQTNSSIGLTYTPWLQDLGLNDVYMVAASGFYKLDEQQGLTASLRYFAQGSIQNVDENATNLGIFRPREFAIDAGYSRKLSEKLALGVALRFISSNLASGLTVPGSVQTARTGTAVAGDIHLYHTNLNDKGQGLTYGVTLSNLGSKISYFKDASNKNFIPAALGAGVAYTKVYDADNKVTITAQISKLLVPLDTSTSAASEEKYSNQGIVSSWGNSFSSPSGFSAQLKQLDICGGVEYGYQDQFFLRVGYFYESPEQGDRKYFTAGAGLKYNTLGLNFSYLIPSGSGITRNPLSNTLRFSLVFDLQGNNNSNAAAPAPAVN